MIYNIAIVNCLLLAAQILMEELLPLFDQIREAQQSGSAPLATVRMGPAYGPLVHKSSDVLVMISFHSARSLPHSPMKFFVLLFNI